ncbi:MAG: hypothetical protein ACT4QC_03015 [Planctomycetaceae bacterium]
MPQFCLFDPALVGAAGHHADFARHVLDAAEVAGWVPALAGHRNCQIETCGRWPVRRVFRDGLWTPQAGHSGLRLAGYAVSACRRAPRWAKALGFGCEQFRDAWRARRFADDVSRILGDLVPGADDLMFVPNATGVEVLGLASLLKSSPSACRPTWHLEFRFDLPAWGAAPPGQGPAVNRLAQAIRTLRTGPAGDRIFCYTDTDDLTASYTALNGGPFATLPIPVDPDVAPRQSAHRRESSKEAQPLVVAYIGDARVEKGFAMLPALIERVWHDLVEPGHVRFVIQANCRSGRGERAARAAHRMLERFPSPQVELLRQPLCADEYRAQLLAAHVLVLPYLASEYAARSSGVMSEALAAGIPTIVPAATWLAAQLHENLRCCGAVSGRPTSARDNHDAKSVCVTTEPAKIPCGAVGAIFDNGPAGLALALREIATHFFHYRQTALAFAERWRPMHHPQRLVEQLSRGAQRSAGRHRPAA